MVTKFTPAIEIKLRTEMEAGSDLDLEARNSIAEENDARIFAMLRERERFIREMDMLIASKPSRIGISMLADGAARNDSKGKWRYKALQYMFFRYSDPHASEKERGNLEKWFKTSRHDSDVPLVVDAIKTYTELKDIVFSGNPDCWTHEQREILKGMEKFLPEHLRERPSATS